MDSDLYIQQFVKDYQLRIEPKTLNGYRLNIERLLAFTDKKIQDISARDIRHWLYHMKELGSRPITVRTYVMGLRTFFRYCFEEGFIAANPMEDIRTPKVGDLPPKSLTREQVQLVRKEVQGKPFERAVIEVLYTTGVRMSELVKIKKSDICWDERSIFIPEGKGKKERIVLFNRECKEFLTGYLASRKDDLPYVFVNPYGTRHAAPPTIRYTFQQYSKKLGFHVTAQRLRHTFASHLIQRGMPVESIQILMGHESPQVTLHYAKLYGDEQKRLYDEWM